MRLERALDLEMRCDTTTAQCARKDVAISAVAGKTVGHDRDKPTTGTQGCQSRGDMACGGKWVFLPHRVARERWVHQNNAGICAKLANSGGVMRRYPTFGKQQAQDFDADGIDFVEVETPALANPGCQHAGARAWFEDAVILANLYEARCQPRQCDRRREVLVSNLFLAADSLGRKLRGELFQSLDGFGRIRR